MYFFSHSFFCFPISYQHLSFSSIWVCPYFAILQVFFLAMLAIKCPLIWECVVRKLLLKGCKLFERLVACRRGGPLPVFGGDQPTIWTRIGIHSPSECDLPKVRILFIHFIQRRCWIMVVKGCHDNNDCLLQVLISSLLLIMVTMVDTCGWSQW